MIKKQTILLCWGYHRKGWIEPFESLNNEFEFVYLFYITKPLNEKRYTKNRILYWGDYSSPYDLLTEISPAKVVFMGVESGYSIGLNIACRNYRIPTYQYQHGLYQEYKVYREIEKKSLEIAKVNKTQQKAERSEIQDNEIVKGAAPKFILNALKARDYLYLPFILLYLLVGRRHGKFKAAKLINHSFRRTDFYICYSSKNATIHRQLDKPNPEQILYTGPPENDKFFVSEIPEQPASKPFYLLIDQPLSGTQYFDVGITRADMNTFYTKLLEFCKLKGATLVIKLHPENYDDNWMLSDPGIKYIREENIVPYVRHCMGCFGTFSTLIIPAIYFKPTILFRLLNSSVQQHLVELGVVADLDFFSFSVEEIDFDKVKTLGADNAQFIEDYMYKSDGLAIARLAGILRS